VPQTLLLADDSVTIQRVIELTFADEDIRVVAVSDGDQAIARAQEQPPDIVLADVGMPGKNGYEVARFFKQSPRLAGIPVVLLTGAFEPIDQRQAAEVGCDGVLAKPFEPQAVIALVKELLGRVRTGPASFPTPSASFPTPSASFPTPSASFTTPSASMLGTSASPDVFGAIGGAPAPTSRGDYFDQLDAAFAKLPGSGRDDATAAKATETQWDILQPPAPAEPLPSPQSSTNASAPASRAAATQPVPPLAEAFAALLEAEQNMPASPATAWGPPPPAITDERVEEIVRRVLDQLSGQMVRETVADLVSTLAERLIREEIDRIKASIK
jgi:CheY-like chemotaxis protein